MKEQAAEKVVTLSLTENGCMVDTVLQGLILFSLGKLCSNYTVIYLSHLIMGLQIEINRAQFAH